jgi:hypothetical protein
LKLVRFPRSLAPTLAALPSISEIPFLGSCPPKDGLAVANLPLNSVKVRGSNGAFTLSTLNPQLPREAAMLITGGSSSTERFTDHVRDSANVKHEKKAGLALCVK